MSTIRVVCVSIAWRQRLLLNMASSGGGGGGGGACRRQRRMGPAPFASFEDLSDETDSPGESAPAPRLPGINEDATPCRLTPSTPRIDISRASSSSHHEDSRDSTPERELFQTTGQRLGLAFREEGALELRSSTEELDFQEPGIEPRRSLGGTTTSVTVAISAQSDHQSLPQHQRKDSQSSDFGGLLSISGRTSRLSSIGSQGSRVSNASHLSVTSGMSRSPSPHKMLLETSFCGSKTGNATNAAGTQNSNTTKLVETELLERVLLSRKHDPTEAILAEGISIECRRKIQPADLLVQLSPVLQHMQAPDEIEENVIEEAPNPPPAPAPRVPPPVKPRTPVAPEKPVRKVPPPKISADVIITVDRPAEDAVSPRSYAANNPNLVPGKTIVAESGIEYTFIPLKGPLPAGKIGNRPAAMQANSASSKANSVPSKANSVPVKTSRNAMSTSTTTAGSNDPEYIRIKLKPDHMYTDEPQSETHTKPATLDLSNGGTAQPVIRSPRPNNSSTPSPSVSRKSSFASLFRAKEYGTSPESPTQMPTNRRKSPRSRSKSSDRERTTECLDKPTKHRSVFTLFKSKKSHHKSKQSLTAEASPPGPASSLHSLEFTFDRPPVKKYYEVPLDGDSIIIPLHSPSGEASAPLCIEAPQQQESQISKASAGHRQSSTSSENIVFTTNLGSDNEIFTTKLPKRNERLVEKNVTAANSATIECTNAVINKREHRESSPATPLSPIQNGLMTDEKPSAVQQLEKVIIEQQVWTKTEVDEKVTIDANTDQDLDADLSERAADTSEQQIVDGNDSSESENETLLKSTSKQTADEDELSSEHERKGLVLQQDSFEDELPYVPTTLPLERSVAVPIVPVKQRATYEIKTCPIERPRSTTPINPSCLEDYCEDAMTAVPAEKLRISLPKDESSPTTTGRVKSPRRWTEFVPKQPKEHGEKQQVEPAPPLPPRGAPKDWINFEEIPERRKAPKRIQTIPSRGALQPPPAPTSSDEANIVYSYVNPEDCKCECHETSGRTPGAAAPPTSAVDGADRHAEDELPLLIMTTDRRSDSSPESQAGAPPPPLKRGAKSKPANAFSHVTKTSS
ncbi:uncharacterized protein CBL_10675 [Carabus blaptoides fortunei]